MIINTMILIKDYNNILMINTAILINNINY